MRGLGFVGSRSAIDLNAVTFDSSRSGGGGADVGVVAGAAAEAAVAGAETTSRVPACWLPIIQPAISPKTTPAMPYAIASDFMVKSDHSGSSIRPGLHPTGRPG